MNTPLPEKIKISDPFYRENIDVYITELQKKINELIDYLATQKKDQTKV